MNVLITAGSRRVALVQAFQSALRASCGGSVIVTDVDASSPAVHVADRAYKVPFSSDSGYIDALLEICAVERVSMVIPTIDDELESIAQARQRFAAMGTTLVCSPADTAAICNDKYRTCAYLTSHGIAAARSWLPGELPAEMPAMLFIKPRVGRGSVGAYAVRDARELAFFLDYVTTPVVQEYLQGPEYTIDVMCDLRGRLLSVVPRERAVIRAGVSDRGRTVKDPVLIALGEQVAQAFTFFGPINIQCRMRGEVPVVFEINPRFSGGIPLTIAAGADFPAMLVRLAQGQPIEPVVGSFRADLWMTSYERALFLPASRLHLDDVAAHVHARVSGAA